MQQAYKTTVTITFVDEDAISAFAIVECSGLRTGRYAVRFDESGPVPVATGCQCGRRTCPHQSAVNRYYQILYSRITGKAVIRKSEPVITASKNANGFVKKVARRVNEDLAYKATLGRQQGFSMLKVS